MTSKSTNDSPALGESDGNTVVLVIEDIPQSLPEAEEYLTSTRNELKLKELDLQHAGITCDTDRTKFEEIDKEQFELDLVVGYNMHIPLWMPNQVLTWAFDEVNFRDYFENSEGAMKHMENAFKAGLMLWGWTPIKFLKVPSNACFVIRYGGKKCSPHGCTLARSFFPNDQLNEFFIFEDFLGQSPKEQIDTMAHELGHVFGLRHYFARMLEPTQPSAIVFDHQETSIMNYGDASSMTDFDRSNLRKLYESVWWGGITHVNGLRVQKYSPARGWTATLDRPSFGLRRH